MSALLMVRAAENMLAAERLNATRLLVCGVCAWLAATPPTTGVVKLRRDRRDRLHGGHAADAVARGRGPLELACIRRRARKALAADSRTDDGVLLGTDDRGVPIHVP